MSAVTTAPLDRIAAASARLEVSRERLRQAMQGRRAATDGSGNQAGAGPSGLAWLDSFETLPGISIVTDVLRRWWEQHPMRVPALLAGEALYAVALPLARRHPLGLVLGAAALGALVVVIRPWRWLAVPTPASGVLPQLTALTKGLTSSLSLMAILAAFAPKASAPSTQSAANGQGPAQGPATPPQPPV
ncbi:MAG: hypothetical protein IPO43_19055 [Rhodoferax sp.]|nr:hypothetical protein [Rhodoferax sp.]